MLKNNFPETRDVIDSTTKKNKDIFFNQSLKLMYLSFAIFHFRTHHSDRVFLRTPSKLSKDHLKTQLFEKQKILS